MQGWLIQPSSVGPCFSLSNWDREARREVLQTLITIGPTARTRILAILEDPEQSWAMIRNALLVLGHVGDQEDDLILVRKFLHHAHPRVREEALIAAIKLKARDIEPILMHAISDKDEKVRQRAIGSLNRISPLSQGSIAKLLDMIKAEPADELGDAEVHDRLAALIIKTLGIMAAPQNPEQIEECILAVALEALGRIGGPCSVEYLEEIAQGDDAFAEQARQGLLLYRKKRTRSS